MNKLMRLSAFIIISTLTFVFPALYAAAEKTAEGRDYVRSDVLDEIEDEDDLSSFRNAILRAGLDKDIAEGSFTVFAPDNDAFKDMDPELIKNLEAIENKDKLRRFVMYHIVPGTVYLLNSNDKTTRMETMSPGDVIIAKQLGKRGHKVFAVNGRKVESTEMHADGILYKLDGFTVDIDQWEFKTPGPNQPKNDYPLIPN